MHKELKLHIIKSLAYTVVLFLIYFLLNFFLNGQVWEGMKISNSAIRTEYCEYNNVEKFFHQSLNTYSNLVYFFFGMIICLTAKADFKKKVFDNKMQQFPELSMLTGICFIYLSIGSSFFHASLTWIGQRVDMNGTYSVSIMLAAVAIFNVFHRITLSDFSKKLILAFLVILIVSFYEVHLLVSSKILLPILILISWVSTSINYFQFRKSRSILVAISSGILFIIAVKIRQLDVVKVGCDPHSFFQGHSLWHFMTGLSCFLGYAFFRYSTFK